MHEELEPWERLAAPRGGTVPGLFSESGSDDAGGVLAATWAGVHRSRDAGATWQPTASGPAVPFAEAVVALATESTLFAAAADGLYRSRDAGDSWQRVLAGSRILSLAACGELVLAGSEQDGVLRSEDGGQSWAGANAGLRDTSVLSLALSPSFETDHLGFAGTASGLYRTRSGARAWREVDLGLAVGPAVQCVAFARGVEAARLVLVGTESHGLLWSADGGGRWTTAEALAGRSVTAVASDARGRIAAATDAGVAVSDADGRQWRTMGAELGPVLSLAFAGSVLLAGLPREGIARSEDGGATWSREPGGLAARVVLGLVAAPTGNGDTHLFTVGLQDGVMASHDGGRTWAARNVGLEDATALGLAIAANGTLVAATSSGVYRSRDGGGSWRQCTEAGTLPVAAVAASRLAPVAVAGTGAGDVVRSEDDGETWGTLGPLPETGCGEIVAVAVAAERAVLVGTRTEGGEASVWRWADRPRRWERILRDRTEGALTLAARADGAALVGLGGRVLRPVPNAYERRDGERWPAWHGRRVGPAEALVTSVATPPPVMGRVAERTLFVATGAGVFVSRDGGDSFAPWSDGLRPRAVVAVALSPGFAQDRLVFGIGLGGTIWRRRDAIKLTAES